MTSEGPTIADLTAMVQQLRLENRRLENQLEERKIEVKSFGMTYVFCGGG